MLLSLKRLFDGSQLIVISHTFILQSFDNHLVCLSNALSFIILDHCLIKLILKHTDLPQLRIVLRVKIYLLSINFLLLVFQILLICLQLLSVCDCFISTSTPDIELVDDFLLRSFWVKLSERTSNLACE